MSVNPITNAIATYITNHLISHLPEKTKSMHGSFSDAKYFEVVDNYITALDNESNKKTICRAIYDYCDQRHVYKEPYESFIRLVSTTLIPHEYREKADREMREILVGNFIQRVCKSCSTFVHSVECIAAIKGADKPKIAYAEKVRTEIINIIDRCTRSIHDDLYRKMSGKKHKEPARDDEKYEKSKEVIEKMAAVIHNLKAEIAERDETIRKLQNLIGKSDMKTEAIAAADKPPILNLADLSMDMMD
jgi:hypothetical protein